MKRKDAITGLILGTAVGDAIGLPREGLSRTRAERLCGVAPLEHRLFMRRGMVSDDTEHTCMLAQALIVSGGEPKRFASSLAWRLRWWLAGLPAGTGIGTARAIFKLWFGFPAAKSGVNSAGNGPAMRSALLGVFAGDDTNRLIELNRLSSRMTHTDVRAEEGALVVALAARYGASHDVDGMDAARFMDEVLVHVTDEPFRERFSTALELLERDAEAVEFAEATGLADGVSGFVIDTVSVAVYCWLRYRDDFRRAVEQAIALGGDSDTVGAIVGALVGATHGPDAIPDSWLDRLCEWPRSVQWMTRVADRVAMVSENREPQKAIALFWPAIVFRNLFLLVVALCHGWRRMFPPY